MKRWAQLACAVATAALLTGCTANANTQATAITLKTENTAFSTREITVGKGKTYQLVLDNKDVQLHDFSIDRIEAKVEQGAAEREHDMDGKNPALHVAADAGKSGTVTFTPTREGTYTYYCTVEGHKDLGMSGKLVVY